MRQSPLLTPGSTHRFEVLLASAMLACVLSFAFVPSARAAFDNTTPRADFAGTHNYQVTGGSLRRTGNDPDGDGNIGDDNNNGVKDSCDVRSSGTASLTGIPTDDDVTIAAAYLYWGGSGSNPDTSVTLNGSPVQVLEPFTENFSEDGYDLDYFGAVADVTSIVRAAGGNGTYTFAGLSVDDGGGGGSTDHCAPSAVVAGWSLFVFYNNPNDPNDPTDSFEPYRYSRIYDGLQYFRDAQVTTNQSGFRVPTFKDGKTTVVTWEGDPDEESSVPGASGSTESLTFGTAYRTGRLPDPPNSCDDDDEIYNSRISNNLTGLCNTGSPGVDISTFDVTEFLDEGIEAASLEYSSGNDLVFLTAQVISTTNTPVVDLSIEKTHSGNFTVGGNGSYQIIVHNNGPEIAVGDNTASPAQHTKVIDTLPAGLTYTSFSGMGWSCTAAGQQVTCINQSDIADGADLPTLTLNVDVSSAAIGSVSNTAVVSHPMFDSNTTNNSDTDVVNVPDPAPPAGGNKLLYLLMGQVDQSHDLTRNVPTTNGTLTWSSNSNNDSQYFYLPPLAEDLVLNSSTVSVRLRGRRASQYGDDRWLRVRLYLNGTGYQDDISSYSNYMNFNDGSYANRNVNLTLDQTTFDEGDQLILRVENVSSSVQLTQRDGNNYSYITLDAATVINVDSVGFFSVPYTDANPLQTKAEWEPGDTIYIRADISDPFGGFDVSALNSTLALADADGGPLILNGVTLTPRTNPTEGDGVPNRILEYSYTIPASPAFGTWTATVTGSEGAENTITHSRNASFTVVPKALSILKSHVGDFTAGAENSYTLAIDNGGAAIPAGTTTTVLDTLAEGLTFVSGTGDDWDCDADGQEVTCTSTAAIAAGGSMAPITLTVAVDGDIGSSVDNQASVGNSSVAGGYQQPGNVDTANILHPDLSGSTKSVEDLNGGDVTPGDTLRYTITVTASAGATASNVSVTDALPANTAGLTFVSTTSGTNASTPTQLSVTGITVPAGQTVVIVFDVTVANAAPGATIANTATITNPAGPGATPSAPTLEVLESQVPDPAAGDKVLYLYDNGTMSRDMSEGPNTSGLSLNTGNTREWVLTPAVAKSLEIGEGIVTINLQARCVNPEWWGCLARLQAQLLDDGTLIGQSSAEWLSGTSTASLALSFNLASSVTIAPGSVLTLRVLNNGVSNSRVYGYYGASSTVSFHTPTVINVDSVGAFAGPLPDSVQPPRFVQGEDAYIRAVVSDPFGSGDITGAHLTITDPGGTVRFDGPMASMDTTAATRTYETAFPIPDNPRIGSWTASVTAFEGEEGEIEHTRIGLFNVEGKITLTKVWSDATDGNAVTLGIAGGTSAEEGASTVPATTTAATATSTAGATITVTEVFTSGLAGDYSPSLQCIREVDDVALELTGSGLSRSFEMPDETAVTCTWTNARTVPLTVVKSAITYSDPVNGTTNPKAIPGALVTYLIIVAAPPETAADEDSIVIRDPLPDDTALFVNDLPDRPGNTPIGFFTSDGAMTFTFGGLGDLDDDVDFSDDEGATWDYVPNPGPDGTDAGVTNLRFNPKGILGPGKQVWLGFRVRVL